MVQDPVVGRVYTFKANGPHAKPTAVKCVSVSGYIGVVGVHDGRHRWAKRSQLSDD